MLRLGIAILAMTLGLSCSETWYEEPPSDHPYYPSSLLQNGNTLFVLASNFDQRYSHANALSIDLAIVDAAVLQTQNPVIMNAVTSSGFIHSFPDGAVFSPLRDEIIFVSREQRSIRTLPLAGSGSLISCPGATTTLGQDCFSADPAAYLDQTNPYYLTLFSSDQQNIDGGIVAFLTDPMVIRPNDRGEFKLPAFVEMERFTWNNADSSAEVVDDIGLGNKLKPPASPQSANRSNARIGGLTEAAGYLYFLAERAVDGLTVTIAPQLARVSLADLNTAPVAGITVATTELPGFGMQISVHSLAVRQLPDALAPTTLQFFMTNGAAGSLFQFELSLSDPLDANNRLKVVQRNRVFACNHPTDIKLSPDQSKVIVACDKGKMLVYDAATLQPLTLDPVVGAVYGRGPVKILFDSRVVAAPFRFYTANFLDGSIGIFDLSDGANPNQVVLTRKGHIFQPSPLSREGGVQ